MTPKVASKSRLIDASGLQKGLRHGKSSAMELSSRFSQILKDRGLRATPSRISTLKVLAQSHQPLSVEELHSRLSGRSKSHADLATVYRNVKTFAEAGVINVMELGTGRKFVELRENSSAHHHHIICESCHKIEPVDVCGIDAHMRLLEKMGYRRLRHRLEFSGLCRNCS